MDDTRILLAHGNGGRLMRELITDIFARHLRNPLLHTDARYIASFARAARHNRVAVVAGDTEVVRRGEGSGLYLTVTGIGVRRAGANLAMARIPPGGGGVGCGPGGGPGVAGG